MLFDVSLHKNLASVYALFGVTLIVLAEAFADPGTKQLSQIQLLLIVQSVILLCAAVGIWRRNYLLGYLLGETIAVGYVALAVVELVTGNFALAIGPIALGGFWLLNAYALRSEFRTLKFPLKVQKPKIGEADAARKAANS